ncbi:transporter substrate-binding domain-containing protein [Oceaniglobus roseus]|uniref:transporter substrate-binding domain-containing protein n=1 Tax=Oceaniglobus roseus TaxID=1737570 RepID=UPI000C7F3804|nr:transporter substrate-binding domain-containing protein [Kandeliimicrobium roseum]
MERPPLLEDLDSLPRGGSLRVAINTGNKALVQVQDGIPLGVCPALARRLAMRVGADFVPVVYDGAAAVIADADRDAWDVGFLALDEDPSKKLCFTRPFLSAAAAFAVRTEGDLHDAGDIDREGHKVLAAAGTGYEMHLRAHLHHATLETAVTPTESFADFRAGRGDAVAGLRDTLERYFDGDHAVRILDGAFAQVDQAMVLPGPAHPGLPALDAFVAEALDDGFIDAAVQDAG